MDDDKQYTITLDDTYDSSAVISSTGSYTSPYDFQFSSNVGTMTISGTDSELDYGYDPSITVPEEGDIKIGDRSLKTFMDTMEKRLAILQPNPAKLEKFEALKKAYEHYKHLESLCELEEDNDMKGPNF